jgi:hypothetical protein
MVYVDGGGWIKKMKVRKRATDQMGESIRFTIGF